MKNREKQREILCQEGQRQGKIERKNSRKGEKLLDKTDGGFAGTAFQAYRVTGQI